MDLLAFVLMDNHFHLIVRTPKANLNEFMRHFNISYTASFNKRHGRSGHLYQGRYTAFLIDADSYLLQVSRYVHLNPVHTDGLTGTDDGHKRRYLRTYPWSSYPDYIGAQRYAFCATADVLTSFGNDKAGYRTFVEKGLTTTERPALRRLISQLAPERILAAVAHHFSTTMEELRKAGPARGIAMELLYRHGGMNQRQIGELLGVDYSTVSVARKRLRAALPRDRSLSEAMTTLERVLHQG